MSDEDFIAKRYLLVFRGIQLDTIDDTVRAARHAGVDEARIVHAMAMRDRCVFLLCNAGTSSEDFQRALDVGSGLFDVAQNLNDLIALRPEVSNERARRAGAKKPRRPKLQEWIDRELQRDAEAKSPTLWAKAPEWITDQIGPRRFADRVTKARKTRNQLAR